MARSPTSPVQDAVDALTAAAGPVRPRVAIVLGSGLGVVADQVREATRIATSDIPHVAPSTAQGHRGQWIVGTIEGVEVVVLAGRLHRYEGWSIDQIVFPVRVMAALGVKTMVFTNAAGGLRPSFRVGEIMVIVDHINWIPLGPQPMHPRSVEPPYDRRLVDLALAAAREGDFVAHQGTYLAVLGPSYETRAEYRMMRRIGADCVGMSTVPEVLEARWRGMRVLGLSMITNVARPDVVQGTSHAEVLDAAAEAAPRIEHILRAVLHDAKGGLSP